MTIRAGCVLCTAVLLSGSPVWAGHEVRSPFVEEGIVELELRGHRTIDGRSAGNQQTHTTEFAYGVNSWWETAIETKVKKEPGGKLLYDSTAWENVFQLTPQGKYWLDVGVLLEYARAARRADPDEIEAKLLLEKDLDPLVVTANLIFNRDIGNNAGKGMGFEYAVRARYPWRRDLEFGVEAFGEPGRLTGFGPVSTQEHQIGPVILGKLDVAGVPGVFKYNAGYLFGLTPATAKGTVKWHVEYEFPF